MNNPFTKQFFSLTEQARIYQKDPAEGERLKAEAAALDAWAEQQSRICTVSDFNAMDIPAKVAFVKSGGAIQ